MGAVTSKSTIATGIACVLARIWRSELVPERTQRTPSSLGRFRRSSSTSSRGRTWLVLWGFTHAKTRYGGRSWAHSRMGSGPCPVPPLVDPCAVGSRGAGSGLPGKQGRGGHCRRRLRLRPVLRINARDLQRCSSGDHSGPVFYHSDYCRRLLALFPFF